MSQTEQEAAIKRRQGIIDGYGALSIAPDGNCVNEPVDGLFFTGGLFWDGRATGLAGTDTGGIMVDGKVTGSTFDPLADQAKGPFQNPVEMALMPDEVIAIVSQIVIARPYINQRRQ